MTDTPDGLTAMQLAFVEHYAANGFKDAKGSALAAGYAEDSARNAYRAVLGSAAVRAAVDDLKEAMRQGLRDRLVGRAERAIGVMESICDDEGANVFARLGAAKEIVEKAGIVTTQKVDETIRETVDDGYADLTTEQLKERLEVLKQMRAAIDGNPNGRKD